MADHDHSSPLDRPRADTSEATPGDKTPDPRDVRRRIHRRRAAGKAPSPLQMVASTFQTLTCDPDPLRLDGRRIGHGLPRRPIPLGELRAILLHAATGRACRDAAWRHLIEAARTRGAAWTVGVAGVALPALRRIATDLAEGYRGDPADLDSAVLTGFLEALRRIDTDRPGVITRLRWAAYRAGVSARYARDGITPMPMPPLESQPPPNPWGHPDLILLDAVAKGVLSPLQAELIGRSRLEDLTLKDAAAELGVGYEAACKARQRGEVRLVAAMRSGDVEHRLSAPTINPGLNPPGEQNRELGVRGRSTNSDGTSEPDGSMQDPDEEGVFCGPARHPTPLPNRPRRRSRNCRRTRTRTRRSDGRDPS